MAEEEKDETLEGAADAGAPAGDELQDGADTPEVEPDVKAADADAVSEDVDDEQDPEGDASADADAPNLFEAITAEVTELRDRYARLQAEWDNYRKRTATERASERVRASENLVVDLLPVLDDLERAISHARESGEGGNLTEGVEAIQNKFLQILEKHKVEQIDALDEPFDAMEHQAVGTEEDESVPEETVLKVFQQGYKMGGRVIRPAMVVTSTGGPAREAEEAEEE